MENLKINIINMARKDGEFVVLYHDYHFHVHYSDDHELSPYRWESATTIERVAQ